MYMYDIIVRNWKERLYAHTGRKMKKLLVEKIMHLIGNSKSKDLTSKTSIEKLIIHFKLLQKEMEKEGILPFKKYI